MREREGDMEFLCYVTIRDERWSRTGTESAEWIEEGV